MSKIAEKVTKSTPRKRSTVVIDANDDYQKADAWLNVGISNPDSLDNPFRFQRGLALYKSGPNASVASRSIIEALEKGVPAEKIIPRFTVTGLSLAGNTPDTISFE